MGQPGPEMGWVCYAVSLQSEQASALWLRAETGTAVD